MEIIKKITDYAKGVLSLLATFVGVAIFAELIFGKFFGEWSVISNFIGYVEQFGEAGFAGLIALLLILSFLPSKEQ